MAEVLPPLDGHPPGLVRYAGEGDIAFVVGVPLDRLGRRRWAAVAATLAPVAEALAALHAAGWVHGDVSPANVVVQPAGTGVLIDLDCTAPVGAARATGTPGFAAPEVVAGAPVTPAAEVWALGEVVRASTVESLPVEVAHALAEDPAARPVAAELAGILRRHAVAEPVDLDAPSPEVRSATTVDYGPRPPAPPAAIPAKARRAGPVAAAASVAVVGIAAPVLHRARPPAAGCPPVAAPLVGDPDGDGCDTAATWSDGVLTIALVPGARPSRVAVGAPGDTVVLGDWDCDGDDTPATYRPSTGALTVWNDWPTAGAGVEPANALEAACDRGEVGPGR